MRILIIGGGIVGLNIAYTLSGDCGNEVYLFEQEPFLGHHASSRNSEVIHAGFAYPPNGLKAQLCIEGKNLTYELLAKLGVPVKRTGKWIVAVTPEEEEALHAMVKNAFESGLSAAEMSFVNPQKAMEAEPCLKDIRAAVFSSTSGIMDTASYIRALEVRLSNSRNVNLIYPCAVRGIDGGVAQTDRGEMEFDIIINSAGLFADEIYKMSGGVKNYQIIPFKGEYYLWRRGTVKTLVYPAPRRFFRNLASDPAKNSNFGIHLHRPLAGNALIGPSHVESPPSKKTDYSIASTPEEFERAISYYTKGVRAEDLTPHQAGNRAKLFLDGKPQGDYHIFREGSVIHLLGIESPGLTAAPAIARHVKNLMGTNSAA